MADATPGLATILIVEDEVDVRSALSEHLGQAGYQVIEVGDGRDALPAVEASRPDVILLDVILPGQDGMEVLSQVRAFDPTIAVVMVTAIEDEKQARSALQLGAVDYVSKPFAATVESRPWHHRARVARSLSLASRLHLGCKFLPLPAAPCNHHTSNLAGFQDSPPSASTRGSVKVRSRLSYATVTRLVNSARHKRARPAGVTIACGTAPASRPPRLIAPAGLEPRPGAVQPPRDRQLSR